MAINEKSTASTNIVDDTISRADLASNTPIQRSNGYSVSNVPRTTGSILLLAMYLLLFPVLRLTGFTHGPGENDSQTILPKSTTFVRQRGQSRASSLLEQLFILANSSVHIPLAYWHEKPVSKKLANIHGHVFLDIGANRGHYSLLCHHNFDQVYSVEPALEHVKTMQRLYRYVSKQPSIVEAAVTDHDGSTTLVLEKESSQKNHVLMETSDFSKPNVTVHSISLDSLVRKYGPTVDLVKLDVEGAEWLVLKGADGTTSKIMRWLVELHDNNRKNELESWMTNHSYHCTWLDNRHLYAWKQS